MLHYGHQLVAICVCLLFGAEQVVYRGFIELFHWKKKLLAAAKNNTMRAVNQNSSVRQLCKGELQIQVIILSNPFHIFI